jgi:deoxyribonuclease-4
MSHRFGAHMSVAGGLERAVVAAGVLGFATVQVFTKNNNQWNARPLTDEQVAAWRRALDETGVADPVAHNSYLINLASPDEALWERSIGAMVVELERCEALGIGGLVCHPGAHTGSGEETGLARVAQAIDEIHRRLPGLRARVLLETTAGQGSCLGHRFEHLGRVLGSVSEPERLGVCADTCHIFAAGYALAPACHYNETMEALDREVGTGRVEVWHLNDSLKGLGSRVDRHAHIGRGCLGAEPFRLLLSDPRWAGARMILETPKGLEDGRDLDAVNLEVLRSLEPAAHGAVARAIGRPARSRGKARKAAGDGRDNG